MILYKKGGNIIRTRNGKEYSSRPAVELSPEEVKRRAQLDLQFKQAEAAMKDIVVNGDISNSKNYKNIVDYPILKRKMDDLNKVRAQERNR